jgi:hypothetical protein
MSSIKKELLIARLSYLDEISNKPGTKATSPLVTPKVKELIEKGEIVDYMALESVFNFLSEKLDQDELQADNYAREIISFLN